MTRNFLSRKIFKVAAVVIIFGSLVFFNPRQIFTPVRFVFFAAARPFQNIFSFTAYKITGVRNFWTSIGQMKEENRTLFEDNQRLIAENAMLTDIKNENESLRRQINLLPRNKFELESALTIGQDPKGVGSWIMIDKGAHSGIETGMPVIVSNGILIGAVSEVFSTSSRVVLLTSSENTINALSLENQSRGVVRGRYGLGLLFDMVLETDTLSEGEQIVTSGIGENIPRGLLIGNVQDIKLSQDGLYQQASVLPAAHYSDLFIVSVIKKI